MKPRIVLLAVSALVGVSAFAAIAGAQGIENRAVNGPVVKPPGVSGSSNAPPPGLPGAAVGADRVTPSNGAAADLPPTEALFDAINRGDLNSARDAIARGADYNGRNILGLTPLDQSIDLSRNNITFLLLSLRGASAETVRSAKTLSSGGGQSGAAGAKGGSKMAVQPAPRPVAPKAAVASNGPSAAQVVTSRQPQAAAPAGVGDRGTPSPQNGFLGFGG